MPIFGCVADDFTGASDAASFLVKGGMSVQLFNGIPAKGSRVGEGVQDPGYRGGSGGYPAVSGVVKGAGG